MHAEICETNAMDREIQKRSNEEMKEKLSQTRPLKTGAKERQVRPPGSTEVELEKGVIKNGNRLEELMLQLIT